MRAHILVKIQFTLILILFAAGINTPVAQASSITGTVVDDQGNALTGATVVLYDILSGQQRYGTATRMGGRFELANIRPGQYGLKVSFIGYAEYYETVHISDIGVRDLSIVLSSFAVLQPEVIISATRAEAQLTPITFSNLSAQELQEKPAMKDIPILLSSLPSITYYSENGNGIGYSSLRMRGFDQRRVGVSINGIPQNDPEDFGVFWINFFDIQGAIQDIQVQRGAGSSFYGPAAIGGAINIIATPYKASSYVKAEVGMGSFETRRYTIEANTGLIDDQFVAFGRFSRLLTDGYRDWSWSEFYRFFAGVVWYNNRSTLTVQAYGGPQRDGLAYSGIPRAANERSITDEWGTNIDRKYNYSAFTEDIEYFHQPHVEVLHDWSLTQQVSAHQKLFWVKGEGYFDFGGTFRSADYLRLPADYRDLSAEERALPLYISAPDVTLLFRAYLDQWQIGWLPHVKIRHGAGHTTIRAEGRLHRSLRWGRTQEATGIPDQLIGSENNERVYSFRGEKAIASIYGTHFARLADRVAIQADLQLTYRQYKTYDEAFFGTYFKIPYLFVNPRIGITLNPDRPNSAYLNIAIANREPRLKSLYDGEEAGAGFQPHFDQKPDGSIDVENPLVKPEQLVDIEFGGQINKRRFRVAANLFFIDFKDEIVPSGGLDQFGIPRNGNAERTRHIGLEVETSSRLGTGLNVFANLTVSRNRYIVFKEHVTLSDGSVLEMDQEGHPIAGFPEQVANLGIRYGRSGFTASLQAKYAGKQYINNSGGKRPDGTPDTDLEVDPYTLVNASFQYTFPVQSVFDGLQVSLDVNNVLNDKILLFGNVSYGVPQFFPTATRHVFFNLRYIIE